MKVEEAQSTHKHTYTNTQADIEAHGQTTENETEGGIERGKGDEEGR
jgi:hypothetical protein